MREIKFRAWREIKFRAWDGEVMSDPFTLGDISDGLVFVYQSSQAFGVYGEYDIEGKEIMQFTGLLDKNSKEIYEGDIVEMITLSSYGSPVGKVRQEVTFDAPCFNITRKNKHWGGYSEVAVIGNIYETPELLGEKNSCNECICCDECMHECVMDI